MDYLKSIYGIDRPKQIIRNLRIGEILTKLKIIPICFEQEDQQEALRHIVYPPGIVDQRLFDSVAHQSIKQLIFKGKLLRKKFHLIKVSIEQLAVLLV
jgi:hypothetical protein